MMTKLLAIALLAFVLLALLASPALAQTETPPPDTVTPGPSSTPGSTAVPILTHTTTVPILWGGWVPYVYAAFVILLLYGLWRFLSGLSGV